ncbi:MAG: hypothetical protein GX556_15130 [Fibrobacter sp.]|nr:hypothetical protein [Fibrobacter sp.]
MRRIDRLPETIFGVENSTVDSNRFYSILLDAKEKNVSGSMCEITEKLLQGEKENAKIALEQLWNLRKNILTGSNRNLDQLINFYQEKIDILRNKEENLKKISKDSKNLLEEKRRKDEEIAEVKQQISEGTKELNELTVRIENLKSKEQELLSVEQRLKQEIDTNENAIINGLYEIVFSSQNEQKASKEPPKEVMPEAVPQEKAVEEVKAEKAETEDVKAEKVKVEEKKADLPQAEPEVVREVLEETQSESGDAAVAVSDLSAREVEISPFPKSVVKTTRGKIIGEYYYDTKVYKNERHYIFSSKFFCEQLFVNHKVLRNGFEQSVYYEMLQMIQDAYKRISENKRLHFEISTNEILNEKTLKHLWQDMKLKSLDEVERFITRLRAKIDVLGSNYTAMLQEQMKRCIGS